VHKAPGVAGGERRALLRRYFRPAKPRAWAKKPTEWLDSFNIADVMAQYEAAFPDFEFLGPVPIDFDARLDDRGRPSAFGQCVTRELCALDLAAAAKRGIARIGIIFNLDPHDKPGSHWVCAFIDLRASAAFYFDSYGMPPPREVAALLARVKAQGVRTVEWNRQRAQRLGSECGVYTLLVLVMLLRGVPFRAICAARLSDAAVNAFRDYLFASDGLRSGALEKALPELAPLLAQAPR
jgi:hypothetical protein